jgi:adenylate cyclase
MRWNRRGQGRAVALLVVAALAGGLGVVAYATHLLRRSELQTIDARFSIRGDRKPPPEVALVLIDNRTFAELTRLHMPSEWPFPRRYEARVIDNVRRAGARTIALDIEFAHETDEADDEALLEALARARGHTVLAETQVGPGRPEILGSAAQRAEVGTRAAEVILPQDSDGAVRRFGLEQGGVPSFPVAITEVATGKRVRRSLFEDGTLPIDFAGPPGKFRAASFSDVLTGRYDPALFRGKTVIIGASAPVLQDVKTTATSGSSVMAGAEIMANAVVTLLRGAPLRPVPGWINILLIVALGAAVPVGSLRVRRWSSLVEAVLLAVLFTVAVQLAFNSGRIVSFVYPLLALVLGTLGTLALLYVQEAIERERVRDVFSRFVPRDVVDQVLATAGDDLRLGGVERDCTVLFSDLRGFTSFSETQPAALVIEVVNRYLDEMTAAILAAGGTLVAYMGDGIMAVFGAPLDQDDHADRAVAAAREMISTRLDRFNAWLAEQGFDRRFEMGVGLHSGSVMVGNVGSEQRMEYTAIGDTTNTASRLEGLTKNSDAMLFISDATHERIRHGADDLQPVGEVEVRGRTQGLFVWTVAPQSPTAAAPAAGSEGAGAGASAKARDGAGSEGGGSQPSERDSGA